MVRHPGGQQVVHTASRGLGDHPNAGPARSRFPRRRRSQEEGIGGCPRLASFPEGLVVRFRRMRPHESLERATHPLARAGVPLHHRTQDLSQSNCHFLALCAKTQIVASKPITNPPPSPREPVLINYRNLWSVHMEIRWERRGLECRHPLPSKMPGSTTRRLSAPIKDKSSDVNSKETWRLSPGWSKSFANRFSRFKGGVTLAKRSFKYS